MRPPRKELPLAAHRGAANLLRQLAALWRRPDVARLRLAVHPRLRRTLGRYSFRTQQIELSPAVLSPNRLTHVLTHEVARAFESLFAHPATKELTPDWIEGYRARREEIVGQEAPSPA